MPTRFCARCGAPLIEGNRFCVKCGQPLTQINPIVPVAPVPPPVATKPMVRRRFWSRPPRYPRLSGPAHYAKSAGRPRAEESHDGNDHRPGGSAGGSGGAAGVLVLFAPACKKSNVVAAAPVVDVPGPPAVATTTPAATPTATPAPTPAPTQTPPAIAPVKPATTPTPVPRVEPPKARKSATATARKLVERPPEDIVPQPAPVAVTPAPVPAVRPTSGVLHYSGPPVPQNGEVVFENLPKARLKFTFDWGAWQPVISRQPNGTRELTLRSLRPGLQTQCDVAWEIIQ